MPLRQVGRVGDGGPREWLLEGLPPVTRVWFVSSFSTTVLAQFGLLDPSRIVWSWAALKTNFELWRLVTPYLYFGGFSFPFLIAMYMLVQYSKNYEVAPYNTGAGGTSADYLWMLVICVGALNVLSTVLGLAAPAQALTTAVLYVWSRKNPTQQVSLYGVAMPAMYFPWAVVALNVVIGNPITLFLAGIGVGHVYYFLVDVVPDTYGQDLVATPRFFCDALGEAPRAQRTAPGQRAAEPAAENRGGRYNWGTGRALGDQ